MLNSLKKRFAEFIEAAFERTIKKFYDQRHYYYTNHTPEVRVPLKQLYLDYRNRVADGKALPSYKEAGFSVYSQYDEDGIALYIFGIIGFKTYKFVDIGSGDCLYASNTANLVTNFGFHGLFIDINQNYHTRAKKFYNHYMFTSIFPPEFHGSGVTKENINQVLKDKGIVGEIDFMSLDIDGIDYWIWDAIDVISPRVILIENNVEFGRNNIVAPYDPEYTFAQKHKHYNGASPIAYNKLAKRKGYHLVAVNWYGFNTFYLRNDLASPYLPEISVEEVLAHPRNIKQMQIFEEMKHLPFETVDQ